MNFIKLFTTGEIDYKDQNIAKPVKFTEEHLQQIAKRTGQIELTNEHKGDTIGSLSNFIYKDGCLQVEAPTDVDINGMGISPVFDCDLRDMGSYYEPVNIILKECGLTQTPRTGILYNSIQNQKGDEQMSNDNLRELLDKKEERMMEQQEEIALLKQKLEEAKKIVDENKELDSKFQEISKQLEQAQSEMEGFKKDAEKLRTQEAEQKKALIQEITGGEEEVPYLNKLSYDELKDMRERTIVTEPLNGQSSEGAEGEDQDGDQDDGEEKVDIYSEEYFNEWDKQNSSW